MFVTVEEIQQITGYNVLPVDITWAQAIIEVYVGRTEADVQDARDLALMARAVAFQAVYMQEHGRMIYEQVDVQSIAVGGAAYVFGPNGVAPYVAPLAVMACNTLSWFRARSVRTGANRHQPRLASWWTT